METNISLDITTDGLSIKVIQDGEVKVDQHYTDKDALRKFASELLEAFPVEKEHVPDESL